MFVVGMIASRGFLAPEARPLGNDAPPARRFVLPTVALLGIVAIGFFSEFIEGSVNNWSALYLSTIRQLSNAEAANGLVMFSLVMTVCRLGGGPVVSRLGERTLIVAGGVLAAAGIAVVLLAPAPQLSPIGFGIVALGISNIVPVLIGAASRTPGMAPGAAVAAMFSAITLGYLTAPPAIGVIAQYFGLAAGIALLGCAGAAIVLIAALRRDWPPVGRPPAPDLKPR
jgi:MFS family permease